MKVRLLCNVGRLSKGQEVEVLNTGEDAQGIFHDVAIPGTERYVEAADAFTYETERVWATDTERVRRSTCA